MKKYWSLVKTAGHQWKDVSGTLPMNIMFSNESGDNEWIITDIANSIKEYLPDIVNQELTVKLRPSNGDVAVLE